MLASAYFVLPTTALNFRLNNSGGIEFGQGVSQQLACSSTTNLTLTPASTFVNSAGAGAHYASSITVANIPDTCNQVVFTIRAFGDSGNTPAALFGASSSTINVYDNAGTFEIGNDGTGLTIQSGSGTFTITFDSAIGIASNLYKFTIETSAAPSTAINSFTFAGLSPVVSGSIDNVLRTITVSVPFGTSITNLIATFSVGSGVTATIGSTAQVSGTTANNFSSPVIYKVAATDGKTVRNYTVSVTVAAKIYYTCDIYYVRTPSSGLPCQIGDTGPLGGTVFYVNYTNKYSKCGEFYKITTTYCYAFEYAPANWDSSNPEAPDARYIATEGGLYNLGVGTSTTTGYGYSNTVKLVTQFPSALLAASAAKNYVVPGFGGAVAGDGTSKSSAGWCLPSFDELGLLYNYFQSTGLGGFVSDVYLSSSQYTDTKYFYAKNFADGTLWTPYSKTGARVRPVHAW